MKLLKELKILKEGYSFNDIKIEDIYINYNTLASNTKYDLACDGVLVNAYFDNTEYGIECIVTLLLHTNYSDASFSYEYGEEHGIHDPGSKWEVGIADIVFNNIKYVDNDGKQIDPNQVISLFGSKENLENQLKTAIVRKIDLDSDVKFQEALEKYFEMHNYPD